ncbi:hypothetical protein [uncultured Parabacteroides sp.]
MRKAFLTADRDIRVTVKDTEDFCLAGDDQRLAVARTETDLFQAR